MSEPIEIYENFNSNAVDEDKSMWEIRRDNLTLFRQECPRAVTSAAQANELSEPLHS